MKELPTCATCRFYESHPGFTGRCHRYPPTPLRGGTGFGPLTAPEDWCGEWRTNEPERNTDSEPT